MSSRAFTAVGLPIMGGNSTPEELFNLNDLRVELLQGVAWAFGPPMGMKVPYLSFRAERGICFSVLHRNSRYFAPLTYAHFQQPARLV